MMSFNLLCLLGLLGGTTSGLAEVVNVALNGIATQSIVWQSSGLSEASNAIDGNKDSNVNHGSCSVTNAHFAPWWRLDLLRKYQVDSVAITNRGDCCPERLNGAEIRIGDSFSYQENQLCATVSYVPAGETRTFKCGGMKGHVVHVVIPARSEYLTLCEVEVFAEYESVSAT